MLTPPGGGKLSKVSAIFNHHQTIVQHSLYSCNMAPPASSPVPSRLVHTLAGHKGPVNVARYNKGARYILTGGQDRQIKLWNAQTGKEIKTYAGHGYEVLGVDVTPDNSKFASCGGDKAVFLWDVASGTVIRRMAAHVSKVNAVAFAGVDTSILVSGSYDAKVMLWDMRAFSKAPIQSFAEATDSITSLAVSPSPHHTEILASSVDGHVRSWDLRMGKVVEDLIGAPVTNVTPSPTSPRDTLLVTSLDSAIRLMDRTNGQMLATFKGHKNESYRSKAIFSHDESNIIFGDEDGKLWVWNVLDNMPTPASGAQIHDRVVTWLEGNPNGKEMVTASADGTVKVWQA